MPHGFLLLILARDYFPHPRITSYNVCYTKLLRALGFPYPGGPHVDKLALEAEQSEELPRAWLEPDSYDFSFSGLKSAVLNAVNQHKMRGEEGYQPAIARGFQESVIEVLVEKAIRAIRSTGA